MTRIRRPSAQTAAVALADKPAAWRYGNELCQLTGSGRALAAELAAAQATAAPARRPHLTVGWRRA